MSRLSRALSFMILLLAITVTATAQNQSYFIHTVTKGQGLYSISRMYGVPESDIERLNPGSRDGLTIGQELRIPKKEQAQQSGTFHTVVKGETLYSLSVRYRVSVKDICDANPGLSADNFKAGEVISIPAQTDASPLQATVDHSGDQALADLLKTAEGKTVTKTSDYKTTHTVEKKETIYKICKEYGITQEEFLQANPAYRNNKLRPGVKVNIPYSSNEIASVQEEKNIAQKLIESLSDSKLFELNIGKSKKIDVVNVALILPFALDGGDQADQKKMVEFYQGVLLALEKLKAEGVSANLKVYDSGSESSTLDDIIDSGRLEDANLIIGPKYGRHISQVAAYANARNIPLVLPLNSSAEEVFNNPEIFQLNTPQSYFMQEIIDHFHKQFSHPRVLMFHTQDEPVSPFAENLTKSLEQDGIPMVTMSVDTSATKILQALDPDCQNIYIIDSQSNGALSTMLPIFQLVERMKDPEISTQLFGYPEYQVYAIDHLDEFFEVNTFFYSWFYTNNTLPESIDFATSFRHAFSKQMMISYPSFASYGYDTAYYFIKAMAEYGTDFTDHLADVSTKPVQMGFKFERVNNWGGFINKKVFFIHLDREFNVHKIDFDK